MTAAAALLSSSAYAQWDKVLFLEANAGYGISPFSKSGNLDNAREPDTNGVVFGGGLGYRVTDNHVLTLNYAKSAYENIEFDNIYLSANFRFRFKESALAPFVGLLAGVSTMRWSTPPVKTNESVKDSTSAMWGVQIGEEYLLSKHFQLYAAYQFTKASHKTSITGMGEFEQNDSHNFIAGVRFSFIDLRRSYQ